MSDGNYKCLWTYKTLLCKNLKWISYMILNQQLTEDQYDDFMSWFEFEKLYATNYKEVKEKGWHKDYKKTNTYVEKKCDLSDYDLYKEVYKDYPNKEELLKYVQKKFKEYWLNIEKATEQLCDMLSIENKTIIIDGKEINISSESYEELKKNLL